MPDRQNPAVPRSTRVAEEIQRLLSQIFLTEVQIPSAGMLTVTRVETSRDLRNAHIYFSFLNPKTDEQNIIAEVVRRRKEIRYHLGSRLGIKYVPQLRFHLDLAAERSARINEIISELHSGDSARRE